MKFVYQSHMEMDLGDLPGGKDLWENTHSGEEIKGNRYLFVRG